MKVTLRLDGLNSDIGISGAETSKEISMELPSPIDGDLISKVIKDVEILNRNTCLNRSAFEEVVEAFNNRNKDDLMSMLKKHGMDEESTIAEGGGLILQVLVGGAILLYSIRAN